jgi:hypothetical protein
MTTTCSQVASKRRKKSSKQTKRQQLRRRKRRIEVCWEKRARSNAIYCETAKKRKEKSGIEAEQMLKVFVL